MDPYELYKEFADSKPLIDFLIDVNGSIREYGLAGIDTLAILSDGLPTEPGRVKQRLRQGLAELGKPGADPFEAQRAFKIALSEVNGFPKKQTQGQIQEDEQARLKQELERVKKEQEDIEQQRQREEQQRQRAQELEALERSRAAEEQKKRTEEDPERARQIKEAWAKAAEIRTSEADGDLSIQIDWATVGILNAQDDDATATLRAGGSVSSQEDASAELLLFLPFRMPVKLQALHLSAPCVAHAPSHVRLFANNQNLDMSDAIQEAPTADFATIPWSDAGDNGTVNAVLEVNFLKFQKLGFLAVHFCREDEDGLPDEDGPPVSVQGLRLIGKL